MAASIRKEPENAARHNSEGSSGGVKEGKATARSYEGLQQRVNGDVQGSAVNSSAIQSHLPRCEFHVAVIHLGLHAGETSTHPCRLPASLISFRAHTLELEFGNDQGADGLTVSHMATSTSLSFSSPLPASWTSVFLRHRAGLTSTTSALGKMLRKSPLGHARSAISGAQATRRFANDQIRLGR